MDKKSIELPAISPSPPAIPIIKSQGQSAGIDLFQPRPRAVVPGGPSAAAVCSPRGMEKPRGMW